MTTPASKTWTTKIQNIKASQLLIDPKVQRSVHPAQVRKLNREWEDMLVGVLIGWRKDDGKVYLLDGQQRLRSKTGHALVPLKITDPNYTFKVEVYEGITEKEAAHIFLGANRGRKNVDAYAQWWVEMTEQNPVAIHMQRAAARAGLTISTDSDKSRISCVSTLRRVIARKGTLAANERALTWALNVYRSSFGTDWRSEMVEALALLKLKYPSVDRWLAVERFSKTDKNVLLGQARMRAIGSNRVSNMLVHVLQEEYDRGRRGNRLVPKED